MLQLKNITKEYVTGDSKVEALKGMSISFRESEFVSILGPSGCGKTTLLNIIGGLDRYTSGDLIINGKSTKDFKDRDWDSYRNHRVGFIFQNYNLIPHQTVLSNVELALTLSGVSKEERRKRAIKALEDVGLGDQIHKKPNQMSGGQMQRVAIARALVNEPDIILADEPTGALDTKTSVQIMEILKKISKDKLIIMVTHNPELAEKYSSRVIRVLDGKVMQDTDTYEVENVDCSPKNNNKTGDKKKEEKGKYTSMNFLTALSLSLNNLMTKKGRTLLTSFAGSIGIIGIALIMSLSNGVQEYINRVEEDTLSSYPITIQESTIDMTSMMSSLMGEGNGNNESQEEGKVYSKNIINEMMSTISNKMENNNLEELKKYLESENNDIQSYSNAVQYSYDLKLNLYQSDVSNGIVQVNPSQVLNKLGMSTESSSMQMSFYQSDIWEEMLDNSSLLQSQYQVLAGKWPDKFNEVILIVDENNQISDYTLYSLGLLSQEELTQKYEKIKNGEKLEEAKQVSYSYDELLNTSFKLLLNTDYYQKENGIWLDKKDDESYMKKKLEKAEEIRIVGIVKQNSESVAGSMSGSIGYSKELTEYVIRKNQEAEIVKEQEKDKKINVFTGISFPEKKDQPFRYQDLDAKQKAYLQTLSQEELTKMMEAYSNNADATYDGNLDKLGVVDVNKPSAIHIYPVDFEAKEKITEAIEQYNQRQREEGKEENVITYTDMVGTMMNSVTSIVNVISYVLIAFVAISLIVSSIMIGIITYISVLERTKEIGILRSIGASKKDISRVFNAETFIVGLVAGLLGIGITVLLTIPINMIIKAIVGISGIASLPVSGAIVLVVISMILTMVAGLIPSKMASKKDPVEALRTE